MRDVKAAYAFKIYGKLCIASCSSQDERVMECVDVNVDSLLFVDARFIGNN